MGERRRRTEETSEPLMKTHYVNPKYKSKAEIHEYIMSFCDADIVEKLGVHGFTLEPLLMQLIRDINGLKK